MQSFNLLNKLIFNGDFFKRCDIITFMKLQYLIILMILFTLFFSCTTSSNYSRGSLSDAMDKAKEENEDDREVPSNEKDDWPYEQEEREKQEENDDKWDEDAYIGEIGSFDPLLSIRGGTNFYSDPYFDSFVEGEILFGAATEDNLFRFFLFGGAKILHAKPDHPINLSIKKDAVQLNGGVEFRYYPFRKLKVFTPYLLARGGGYLLFWTFQNELTSGGDIITSDSVGGLLLGTGVGIDIIQEKSFFLGAQLVPELYLFGDETSEGFINDYFDSYGTVRVTFEAGFSI